MRQDDKVICWDFDETIGIFRHPRRKILRKGIVELLEELKEEGYHNFIASSGHEGYVESRLKSTPLDGHFEGIYGRDSVKPAWGPPEGKFYYDIAKAVGIPDFDIQHRMIAVGDQESDQPTNLDGMVFIHHPDCVLHDAVVTKLILNGLKDKDRTSLRRGFDKLKEANLTDLGGVRLRFEYRNNPYNKAITPTIMVFGVAKQYLALNTI